MKWSLINSVLLSYSVHGMDGMKSAPLHSVHYFTHSFQYLAFDYSFHCNELFLFGCAMALARCFDRQHQNVSIQQWRQQTDMLAEGNPAIIVGPYLVF
jgi:hypothetical protein